MSSGYISYTKTGFLLALFTGRIPIFRVKYNGLKKSTDFTRRFGFESGTDFKLLNTIRFLVDKIKKVHRRESVDFGNPLY